MNTMSHVEILIPTYNRDIFLRRNIELLSKEINENGLQKRVSIFISDNASTDDTAKIVKEVVNNNDSITIKYHRREQNTGLEANAFYLLEHSISPYVMYLGDDDYLPQGYLNKVLQLIDADNKVRCIIPGISMLWNDGNLTLARHATFEQKLYPAGYETILQLVQYGHQLSGITFKREGLAEEYAKCADLRNIYLFIFFVGYNMQRGKTWYLPGQRVLVSVSNSKDWNYDDAGLLPEILKNFRLLYPLSPIKRFWLSQRFMFQQPSRLEFTNPSRVTKAYACMVRSEFVEPIIKLLLPVTYFFLYVRSIKNRLTRYMKNVTNYCKQIKEIF